MLIESIYSKTSFWDCNLFPGFCFDFIWLKFYSNQVDPKTNYKLVIFFPNLEILFIIVVFAIIIYLIFQLCEFYHKLVSDI